MIFVVSDIHGDFKAWRKLKNALNANDLCYVLGDACDRERHGIQILSEIMEDKRFHYLIGNHDDFIIRTFRADLIHSRIKTSEWAKECWLYNEEFSYYEWIELSNSNPTKFKELLEWLANCDVFYTICVNNNTFKLAHAKYPKQMEESNMSWKRMEKYFSNILISTIWDRYTKCNSETELKKYVSSDCITLIGHTPIYNNNPEITKGLYNLDTGLGHGCDEVRVYCLDDCQFYKVQEGVKLPNVPNK